MGAALGKALQAADELAREGIEVEVVDVRTLAPLDLPTILRSVRRTGRLVTVEDAALTQKRLRLGNSGPRRRGRVRRAPVRPAPGRCAGRPNPLLQCPRERGLAGRRARGRRGSVYSRGVTVTRASSPLALAVGLLGTGCVIGPEPVGSRGT